MINRAQFLDNLREQHANERKYVHEFDIISSKIVKQMSDLTENEIALWKKWLSYYWSKDTNSNEFDHVTDFFNIEDVGEDAYNDEIQVQVWKWTHDGQDDYLYDLNAWPGDNESGGIFLHGDLVFENGDQSLYYLQTTPEDIKLRRNALGHLRTFQCTQEEDYDEDPVAHQHCELVYQHRKDVKGESAYIHLDYGMLKERLGMKAYQIWDVSPYLPTVEGNVKLFFGYTADHGYEYIAEVQYDAKTGMIYPPRT